MLFVFFLNVSVNGIEHCSISLNMFNYIHCNTIPALNLIKSDLWLEACWHHLRNHIVQVVYNLQGHQSQTKRETTIGFM